MNETHTYSLISIAAAFEQAPVVSSFSSTSGPAGVSVTIKGSGFATTAKNIVFFGATQAGVIAASAINRKQQHDDNYKTRQGN
jgi:hypothetical protein